MRRPAILTLFGRNAEPEGQFMVSTLRDFPSSPCTMAEDVNSGPLYGEGTENEANLLNRRIPEIEPHSLRRMLTTLAGGMKCLNVAEAGEHCERGVRSDSAEDSGSETRMNSALRRWSVEREASLASAEPVAGTATPLDQDIELNEPLTTVDEPPQFTAAESPEPIEQDSGSDTAEEKDGSEHRETAQEEQRSADCPEDYYEILQISRHADLETIHRVYRMMAFRLHPDNAKTGNLERFLVLKRAYQVLSDPDQRAAYDVAHTTAHTQPLPAFESKDFLYGIEGEMNRRLGVLSLLYHKRRLGEGSCGISVLELERRMAFPREYLSFTLWYLRSRGYITVEDNSDYALTGNGVDFVEAHSVRNHAIRQLLTAGTGSEGTEARFEEGRGPSIPAAVAASPRAHMTKRGVRHDARRRAERKR